MAGQNAVASYNDVNDMDSQDVAIVLMGLTGSGKSTFISLLTDEYVEVGHSLQACTTKASIYSFKHKSGVSVNLIDTPGFDDTTRSDTDVLKEIAVVLNEIYREGIPLAGLIYLHRITDLKMSGSAMKSLRMLQKVCGQSTYGNVVLVTTMWDVLAQSPQSFEIGTQREEVLKHKDDFWGRMIKEGSRVRRHAGDVDSAGQIIDLLISQESNVVLQLQKEMVDLGKTLGETSAGQFLQKEFLETRRRHEKELVDLKQELQAAIEEKDGDSIAVLSDQLCERQEMIHQADADREALKIGYKQLVEDKEAKSKKATRDSDKEKAQSQAKVETCKKEIAELREQLAQIQTGPNSNQDLHQALRIQEYRLAATAQRTQFEIQMQQQQWYELQRLEVYRLEAEEQLQAKEAELRSHRRRNTPICRLKDLFVSVAMIDDGYEANSEPSPSRPTRGVLPHRRKTKFPNGGILQRR